MGFDDFEGLGKGSAFCLYLNEVLSQGHLPQVKFMALSGSHRNWARENFPIQVDQPDIGSAKSFFSLNKHIVLSWIGKSLDCKWGLKAWIHRSYDESGLMEALGKLVASPSRCLDDRFTSGPIHPGIGAGIGVPSGGDYLRRQGLALGTHRGQQK